MYPLTLLRISRNKIVELELKNDDSVRGLLHRCDMLMNLHLKSVTIERSDGSSWFINECYLRGSSIKYVKLNSNILLLQKEEWRPKRQFLTIYNEIVCIHESYNKKICLNIF